MKINKATYIRNAGGQWLEIETDIGNGSIQYALKAQMLSDGVCYVIGMEEQFPGVRGRDSGYVYPPGVTDDEQITKLAGAFYRAVRDKALEPGDFPLE